ncbi:MAG: SUMF1/EgtB/PvdO family nonheme iron enzyme [Planctomycetes bacterium]|nr:SUMF1/EgtB/PvdO family nonheme iron enzyme [Planctomycetota bacterium]
MRRLAPALLGLLLCTLTSQTAQEPPQAAAVLRTPAGDFVALPDNALGFREFKRVKDGAVMVLVPGGVFRKRVYVGDPLVPADSFPLHLDSLLMDKFEVTNAQAAAALNAMGDIKFEAGKATRNGKLMAETHEWGLDLSSGRAVVQKGYENHPSVGASGHFALAYSRWAGGDLPRGYEWEKAAAGPAGFEFPWGTGMPDHLRCNSYLHGPRHTMPVGSYPQGVSPYGLHDMAGNVYDRCYWAETPNDLNREPRLGMIRGGSWLSPHWANLRCIDRCGQDMDAAEGSVGFRCVIRDAAVLKALGIVEPPRVRCVDDVDAAFDEAKARNVPILLFLCFETCGQCDRTRTEIFGDPRFIAWMNENAILLVGHHPGDGAQDPVEPKTGDSLLYPGCRNENLARTFEYFGGVERRVVPRQIMEFKMSPGIFALMPHTQLMEEPDHLVLLGEDEFPKDGHDVDAFLANLKRAQEMLGPGQPRADFVAGKPGPQTKWQPPADKE